MHAREKAAFASAFLIRTPPPPASVRALSATSAGRLWPLPARRPLHLRLPPRDAPRAQIAPPPPAATGRSPCGGRAASAAPCGPHPASRPRRIRRPPLVAPCAQDRRWASAGDRTGAHLATLSLRLIRNQNVEPAAAPARVRLTPVLSSSTFISRHPLIAINVNSGISRAVDARLQNQRRINCRAPHCRSRRPQVRNGSKDRGTQAGSHAGAQVFPNSIN